MKTIEEIKGEIRKNIRWERDFPDIGGQSCGIQYTPVTLISDELDFSISINHFRTDHQNRRMMMTFFELALDELLK